VSCLGTSIARAASNIGCSDDDIKLHVAFWQQAFIPGGIRDLCPDKRDDRAI
jgi:hypothetical protein